MKAVLISVAILALLLTALSFAIRRWLFARVDSMPVEITTADQRARGERSFLIRKGEHQFGITWAGLFTLLILGCLGFGFLFAVVWIVLSHTSKS